MTLLTLNLVVQLTNCFEDEEAFRLSFLSLLWNGEESIHHRITCYRRAPSNITVVTAGTLLPQYHPHSRIVSETRLTFRGYLSLGGAPKPWSLNFAPQDSSLAKSWHQMPNKFRGELKMETILRRGGQVPTLVIFESKNGSNIPTATCSSAPRSPVVGHCGTVDHEPQYVTASPAQIYLLILVTAIGRLRSISNSNIETRLWIRYARTGRKHPSPSKNCLVRCLLVR